MSRLSRNLELLLRSERLLAELQLGLLSRKLVLLVAATIAGLLALAMGNAAGYFALASPLGPPAAALIVALIDALIAGLVAVAALALKAGREQDTVREVRDMAMSEVGAELEQLQQRLAQTTDNLERAGTSVASFVASPLDTLLPHLVVPAITAVTSLAKSAKKRQDPKA